MWRLVNFQPERSFWLSFMSLYFLEEWNGSLVLQSSAAVFRCVKCPLLNLFCTGGANMPLFPLNFLIATKRLNFLWLSYPDFEFCLFTQNFWTFGADRTIGSDVISVLLEGTYGFFPFLIIGLALNSHKMFCKQSASSIAVIMCIQHYNVHQNFDGNLPSCKKSLF